MTASIDRVFQVVQRLSSAEQLELIQAISQALLRQYREGETDAIPKSVKRTAPVTDLGQLVADFWPADETVDDITAYISQQRHADQMNDPLRKL